MHGKRVLGVVGVAALFLAADAAAATKTVGRVTVTKVEESTSLAVSRVRQALAERFAAPEGRRFPEVRVVSVRPRDDGRFDATLYDYAVQRGYEVLLEAEGKELARTPLPGQPARSPAELEDAATLVRESAAFGSGLAKGGVLELYEPMPPVSVDAAGRRLVNVGVMSHPSAGNPLQANEIVSVDLASGEIVRYEAKAPDTARATVALACGPGTSGCSYSSTSCASYLVSWPSSNPVWTMKVRHPSCTNDVQGDGTGLEITDVTFQDRLILKRGEVPVLNVLYAGNTCGPYRDWLDSEDCFQAAGTDVPGTGSGIRVASAPPTTLCESQSDAGNFRGVAIYDEGDSLLLMTETTAGWYRYVMEWRFGMDGSIHPRFGFGATSNSCTCNEHYHHAYWRLEWALDGSTADTTSGIATLERLRAGTPDTWDPVAAEGTFVRPAADSEKDWFRITNPVTGNGYVLKPGAQDGNATGDTYGKWDLAALAWNSNEINDANTNTSVNVAPWVTGEAIGAGKRLVTWYHSTYDHNDPGGNGEPCEISGPDLIPLAPCAGTVTLDANVFACGAAPTLTLNDRDLAGSGSAPVVVTSNTEPAGEPRILTESPAGSGHFVGTMPTTAAPAVPGDGQLSVADGDTLRVQYLDASSCGTPNVPVEKTAAMDCLPPALSNVRASVSGNSATIQWDSSEAATTVVHYGTSAPTGETASVPGRVSAHSVLLYGLTSCTTYYYWVESADEAGNLSTTHGGGGYLAFTTGTNPVQTFGSSGAPVPIPDNDATGATSTIDVADSRTVLDVNVTVNVTHTYDGDLVLSLLPPATPAVTLSNRRGGSQDNFTATVFDDEGSLPISSGTAPFTGAFRPEGLLSTADGLSAAGAWRFRVVDQAGVDVGTIDSWSLALSFPAQTCTPGGPPKPAQAMTASRLDASSIHLGWDAAGCPTPNYHLLYGPLATVASYTVSGGVCGLGPLGSYDWSGVPAGDLWFVVVGDDAAGTEGSWGQASGGAERGGTTASGQCGFTLRSNGGTCP
ncbi:MAG TPA: proprotein convertase P-domain-containing protein [Candidatus Polarisedimenticolaceae bacterium]|nr:proprotein convertase P-domain-containing protein [Candidatus Polarisedimenticolaceae bacterium]